MTTEIIVGITVALIAAGILYVFRIRQLYLVLPRLFEYLNLSDNGKSAELILINRGRAAEKDIRVGLNPAFNYAILGATTGNIELRKNEIIFPRIPPKAEISAVLLIEGGGFTKSDISSVSSEATKARVLEKLDEVPPNYGNLAIGVAIFLSAPVLGFQSFELYESYKEEQLLASLSSVSEQGWSKLDGYISSELYGVYGGKRLPITQLSTQMNEGDLVMRFEVDNLTPRYMSVSANAALLGWTHGLTC